MPDLMTLIGIGKPKEGEEKPGGMRQKRMRKAARSLIDAIADDDEEGVAMALEASHKLCAAMAEGEEPEEKTDDSIYEE